jgi:hypothetical protein
VVAGHHAHRERHEPAVADGDGGFGAPPLDVRVSLASRVVFFAKRNVFVFVLVLVVFVFGILRFSNSASLEVRASARRVSSRVLATRRRRDGFSKRFVAAFLSLRLRREKPAERPDASFFGGGARM